MSREMVYDTIQSTIRSYLPDARIVLFGSRAKGNDDMHSDYDLLVITPNFLTVKEKLGYSSAMNKAIVKAIKAPVDLLVYSEAEIHQKSVLPGHIVRSAIREGIAL